MPPEQAVQVKNAELTLDSIRKDILEETEILTGIHNAKKKVLEDVAKAEANLEQRNKDVVSAEQALVDERLRMVDERKTHDSAILRKKEEAKVLEKQNSQAMTELGRVNDWILTAETNKTTLDETLKSLKDQEGSLNAYIISLAGIKEEHGQASENLEKAKAEVALVVDEALAKTEALKKEAEQAVLTRDSAHGETETERTALTELKTEQSRIAKDLQVYIARVEEKFGEAFPDLIMKI